MTSCPSGISGQNAIGSMLIEIHWISSLMVLEKKRCWKSLSLFKIGKCDKQSDDSKIERVAIIYSLTWT